MSQSINEMLEHWEKSKANPSSTPLPQRFYDVRKRPTGKPRIRMHSITPMGEALRCQRRGLDKKHAKPMADPLRHSEIGEPEDR